MGKVDINLGIHNRWDIEVIDSKTGEVKQTATGYNVICDAFFNGFLSTENNRWPSVSAIVYGTGTGSPSSSDVGLFNTYGELTVVHNIKEHVDMDAGVYSITRKYILNPEDAIGIDITEVGLIYRTGSPLTDYRLYTHAVFQDANGNPIVIHKTAIDIINIYSTFFVHFNPNGYDNGYIKVLDTFDNYNGNNVWSVEGQVTPHCGLSVFTGYKRWYEFGNDYTGHDNVLGDTSGKNAGAICVKRFGDNASYRYNFIDQHPDSEVKDGTYAITRSGLRFVASRVYDNCDNTNQLTEVLFSGARYDGGSSSIRSLPLFSFKPGGSWFSGAAIAQEAVGTGDGVTTKFKTKFSNIKSNTCHVYVDGIETNQVTICNEMPDMILTPAIFAYWFLFPLTYGSTANHPTICGNYKDYINDRMVGYTRYLLRDNSTFNGSAMSLSCVYSNDSYITDRVFYNTIYDKIGMKKISYYFYPGSDRYTFVSSRFYFAMSNDLENWIAIVDDNMTSGDAEGLREFDIPLQYQHYKFIKITCTIVCYRTQTYFTDNYTPIIVNTINPSRNYTDNYRFAIELTDEGYDIIFDTPPADGAIITADYTSLSLAKDSDHVFDFEFTINLNEYSGS